MTACCHSNYVSVINQTCRNASTDMITDASACLLALLKVHARHLVTAAQFTKLTVLSRAMQFLSWLTFYFKHVTTTYRSHRRSKLAYNFSLFMPAYLWVSGFIFYLTLLYLVNPSSYRSQSRGIICYNIILMISLRLYLIFLTRVDFSIRL